MLALLSSSLCLIYVCFLWNAGHENSWKCFFLIQSRPGKVRMGTSFTICMNDDNLRFFLIAFWNTCKCWRKCLWNLRFHHFVESLSHFLLMSLDLAHCRDVALRDLVMVLHIVLQRLIVVVLHLFAGHASHFWKLVSLVIGLGHRYLILRVEGQFTVAAL